MRITRVSSCLGALVRITSLSVHKICALGRLYDEWGDSSDQKNHRGDLLWKDQLIETIQRRRAIGSSWLMLVIALFGIYSCWGVWCTCAPILK